MPGPEQHCRCLVPDKEGKQPGAGTGWRAAGGARRGWGRVRAPQAGLTPTFPQHWIANNLFGLAFSLNGVELLHLNNVSTGCILLGGLFIYDVFWVSLFLLPSLWPRQQSSDGRQQPWPGIQAPEQVLSGLSCPHP